MILKSLSLELLELIFIFCDNPWKLFCTCQLFRSIGLNPIVQARWALFHHRKPSTAFLTLLRLPLVNLRCLRFVEKYQKKGKKIKLKDQPIPLFMLKQLKTYSLVIQDFIQHRKGHSCFLS